MTVRDQSMSLAPATWGGHFPITSMVLHSLICRAALTEASFSYAEGQLYAACEFWEAVQDGTLIEHLDADPDDALRAARVLFFTIGAKHVASTLERAIDACAVLAVQEPSRQFLGKLEKRLRCTPDPVDQLIANFACGCVPKRFWKGQPAGTVLTQVSETPDFQPQSPS